MKKIILGIVMLVSMILTSCEHTVMSGSIKYKVVDTTYIKYNFFTLSDYYVIIKIDSSYYSARINARQDLYQIDRKLKNIK